jgi:hypothetical protein
MKTLMIMLHYNKKKYRIEAELATNRISKLYEMVLNHIKNIGGVEVLRINAFIQGLRDCFDSILQNVGFVRLHTVKTRTATRLPETVPRVAPLN